MLFKENPTESWLSLCLWTVYTELHITCTWDDKTSVAEWPIFCLYVPMYCSALAYKRSFLTYRSTSQMRRGEKFSQHAVPVTKELYTEKEFEGETEREEMKCLTKVFKQTEIKFLQWHLKQQNKNVMIINYYSYLRYWLKRMSFRQTQPHSLANKYIRVVSGLPLKLTVCHKQNQIWYMFIQAKQAKQKETARGLPFGFNCHKAPFTTKQWSVNHC